VHAVERGEGLRLTFTIRLPLPRAGRRRGGWAPLPARPVRLLRPASSACGPNDDQSPRHAVPYCFTEPGASLPPTAPRRRGAGLPALESCPDVPALGPRPAERGRPYSLNPEPAHDRATTAAAAPLAVDLTAYGGLQDRDPRPVDAGFDLFVIAGFDPEAGPRSSGGLVKSRALRPPHQRPYARSGLNRAPAAGRRDSPSPRAAFPCKVRSFLDAPAFSSRSPPRPVLIPRKNLRPPSCRMWRPRASWICHRLVASRLRSLGVELVGLPSITSLTPRSPALVQVVTHGGAALVVDTFLLESVSP